MKTYLYLKNNLYKFTIAGLLLLAGGFTTQTNAADIATNDGSSTCAITADQKLKCWGANDHGQLGDGTFNPSNTPVDVDLSALGQATIKSISGGGGHFCLIDSTQALYCWGPNFFGNLGIGNYTHAPVPTPVQGMSAVIKVISGGDAQTCAIKADGTLWCWGSNAEKQLGVPSPSTSPVPIQVTGLPSGAVIDVITNYSGTCVLMADGEIWCWGNSSHIPQHIQGFTATVKSLVPNNKMCALLENHQVMCWDNINSGPTPFSTPISVTNIVLGTGGKVCALNMGEVWCWNYIWSNEAITQATGLNDVYSLAVGYQYACVVRVMGEIYCWGDNSKGQLGIGMEGGPKPPVEVVGMDGAVKVSSGAHHTCAIGNNHIGISCWGSNSAGEIGDGSTEQRLVPVEVSGTTNATVTALSTGDEYSCAIIDNNPMCWGKNQWGQLGNNSTNNSSVPVMVQGLSEILYKSNSV